MLIIRCVFFSVCLLSLNLITFKFIHAVTGPRIDPILLLNVSHCIVVFIIYTTMCLSIHLLMDFWVVFSLRILQYSYYEHLCTSFYGHMLSLLLIKYLGVQWLSYMVPVDLTLY